MFKDTNFKGFDGCQKVTEQTYGLYQSVGQCQSYPRYELLRTTYNAMTTAQKYELGSYVNLMNSSTQLLVNPIVGLQPCFQETDFKKFVDSHFRNIRPSTCYNQKHLIMSLANLLYEVEVDSKDRKLLWKALRNNKDFLKSCSITKDNFTFDLVEASVNALRCKRAQEKTA